MLDQFSPYALIDQLNPVFQYDQRHLSRLKTTRELRQYNKLIWLLIPGVALVWWMVQRLISGVAPSEFERNLTTLLLYLSLGLMPICSVYTIVTVIGPLNRLFHLGQWRLLRITGQPENDILQAKEAIAQIRVWLVIAVEVGLRIIIVTVFLLNNFYAFYQISLSRDYFLLTAILNPLCWGFYLLVSVIGVVFAVEPIFRMRVIVALGIATAMQVRQTTIAFLTGFALVLPVQIIQVALIGGLMAGYQTLAHAGEEVDVMMVFALTGLSVLVELVGYVVYVGLRKATLWFIYRRALGLD